MEGAITLGGRGETAATSADLSVVSCDEEKREVEEILNGIGKPYAIIRPTPIFGEGACCSTIWPGRCGGVQVRRSGGAAVAEWRETRARMGDGSVGSRVYWAVAAVRRWVLEAEMLRDWQLTLPPETEPLD